jgi:putative flippase GtrA
MDKLLGHSRQFGVYVAVGVLSALVDVGTMQFLIWNGVYYSSATTAAYLVSLLVNYGFHSALTFEAGPSTVRFVRFLCVSGANYLLVMGCVVAGQMLCGSPLAGKIVSLPLAAICGYLFGKFWIFK